MTYSIYGVVNSDFPTKESAIAWAAEQVKDYVFDELTIGEIVAEVTAVESVRKAKVKDFK